MQPKYSQAAFDAFAMQQGLDEEYRQKLAALMGVQQPAPMAADAGAMVGGMDPYAPQPMDMYAQTPPANYTPSAGFSDVASDAPQGLIERSPEPPKMDAGLWKTDPKAYMEQQNALRAAPPQEPNLIERAGAAIKGMRNTPDNFQPAPAQPAGAAAPAVDPALAEAQALEKQAGQQQPQIPTLDLRGGGSNVGASAGAIANFKKLGAESAQADKEYQDQFAAAGKAKADIMVPGARTDDEMSNIFSQQKDMLVDEANRAEDMKKRFDANAAEINANVRKEQDKLMGMDPLDPKRAWNQADITGKLGLAMAYVGAAFSQNYGGNKDAFNMVDNMVFGKDLEAQKAAYDKQQGNVDIEKNRYGALMQQYKDDNAARAAFLEPMREAFASKLKAAIASGKGQEAMAGYKSMLEDVDLALAQGRATKAAGAERAAAMLLSQQAGRQTGNDMAILKDESAQKELGQGHVAFGNQDFYLRGGGTPEAAKIRDDLKTASTFLNDIDKAIQLGSKTSAAGQVGPIATQDFKLLISKMNDLTTSYSKAKGLGALDRGTLDLFKEIAGNPNRNVTDTIAQLQQLRAATMNGASQFVNTYGLQKLQRANVQLPGYPVPQARFIPMGWANSSGADMSPPTPVKAAR